MKKITMYLFLFLLFCFWGSLLFNVIPDEVWNYGFAHNIFMGLVPYKDFNMIIPPFYPFIMSLGFHIFGSNIIVMYFENSLILLCMYFLLDKMIGKNSLICILLLFTSSNFLFPSYNLFLLFLYVLLLYLERNNGNDYFIGLIVGIAVLTKHSVGIFFLLPCIIYYISDIKKICKRIIGFMLPITIFLLYLLFSNTYMQFIDLCILGLFDFAKENSINFTFTHIISIMLLLFNITFIIKNHKEIRNYYSLCFLTVLIPLFDYYHVDLAIISTMISFFINVNVRLKLRMNMFFVTSVMLIFILSISKRLDDITYFNNLSHFQYYAIKSEDVSVNLELSEFIKNKNGEQKIIFLTEDAYFFKIVNDIPIDYLDLINTGNWGYHGSKKLLNTIKNQKNAIYILGNDELKFCQTDKKVLNYIYNNGYKIKSIGKYDIYILNNN